MDVKYPGLGLYTKSNIIFKSDMNKKLSAILSVHRPTEEEKSVFKTGQCYNGSYPGNDLVDDTKTLFVDDPSGTSTGNILNNQRPYYYQNFHQLLNIFDYGALKIVVEAAGFTVINGWYTDHVIDTLYPHDAEINPSLCKKTKVVIVAQKK